MCFQRGRLDDRAGNDVTFAAEERDRKGFSSTGSLNRHQVKGDFLGGHSLTRTSLNRFLAIVASLDFHSSNLICFNLLKIILA